MRNSDTPPRRPNRQLPGIALMALAMLGGCATQGDFGEVHPSLVREDIHDWVGRKPSDRPLSFFTENYLTDDERLLRDLAYPYMEAPYERKKWNSVFGEYWIVDSPERFNQYAYANNLMSERFRSASARYVKLIEDIRNDSTRLPQFFETAARVLNIDEKRRKSLFYVSAVSAIEKKNALTRIKENASIVSLIRANLELRATKYRIALERLVIVTPTTQAVEAERELNHFRAQVAYYRDHAAPTWAREQSLAEPN